MLSGKYHVAGVQVMQSSPRTEKVRKGFLKSVGVKMKLEGWVGLAGSLGEEGIPGAWPL